MCRRFINPLITNQKIIIKISIYYSSLRRRLIVRDSLPLFLVHGFQQVSGVAIIDDIATVRYQPPLCRLPYSLQRLLSHAPSLERFRVKLRVLSSDLVQQHVSHSEQRDLYLDPSNVVPDYHYSAMLLMW